MRRRLLPLLTALLIACSGGEPPAPEAVTRTGAAPAPDDAGAAGGAASDAGSAEAPVGVEPSDAAEAGAVDAGGDGEADAPGPDRPGDRDAGDVPAAPDAAPDAAVRGGAQEEAPPEIADAEPAPEGGGAGGEGAAAAPEASPPAPTVTYTLSGGLYVLVYKDPNTAGAGISHDHAIQATGWSGTARWNADDPSQCVVDIALPVSGLVPDQASVRRRFGLEGELSEGQRGQVRDNMLDESQLNGGAHPKITFRSTSCAGEGEQITVTGDLTIRGRAERISASMTVRADGASFAASGSFQARATDFGFEPYSAMFGALKNKDAMTFRVDVTGAP